MFNHEPSDYSCPFCKLVAGDEGKLNPQDDIVYQNEFVTATIAPRYWPNNPGHVIIVSNKHYENIYDIPVEVLGEIYKAVKEISVALRGAYPDCTGTSTRQHNEPDGGQDVWHFHAHVFPRYENDNLYTLSPAPEYLTAKQSRGYADTLHAFLSTNS